MNNDAVEKMAAAIQKATFDVYWPSDPRPKNEKDAHLIVAQAAIKAYEEAQWQPIDENTPRDGIDLYGTRNGEKRRFTNAKWSEVTFGGRGLNTCRWHHDQWDMYGVFEYTHWRPISTPPKEPEE